MKRLWPWLKTHFYPVSIILVIILVTLSTLTNGFAGLREGMTSIGREMGEWNKTLRTTSASLIGQVWCVTTFTDEKGQLKFGHYPGMNAEEVLIFHNGPIWLLRDPDQQQKTTCFRSWRAAAEAGKLEISDSTTEEEYKNAVLDLYLDISRQDPTPVVANSTKEDTVEDGTPLSETLPTEIWCFSEIKTINNLIVTVPHLPGGRDAIETVLNELPDRSEFEQYTIRTSLCFKSWPEAIDYITGGEVWLPDNATQNDYQEAFKKWQDGKR
jgi:hypothetical protein